MATDEFGVVCEVEPATHPDLMRVRHQIGVLSRTASAFLIPDNHIGRATVSSIAVAHEVALMGGRSIACLNARDRNMLGFRRDLLTAAAYGVNEFLFVYGDRPETGSRSDDLTVRSMLTEARRFALTEDGLEHLRVGVTTRLSPLPSWKREADFLFVQVSWSLPALLAWRSSLDFDGPVFAGVMVPTSATMAASSQPTSQNSRSPTTSSQRWRTTLKPGSTSPARWCETSKPRAPSTACTSSQSPATARSPSASRISDQRSVPAFGGTRAGTAPHWLRAAAPAV